MFRIKDPDKNKMLHNYRFFLLLCHNNCLHSQSRAFRSEKRGFDCFAGFKTWDHIKSLEFENSVPKHPGKKKELEKLANNLNETDNPVLVMVRLKK